MSKEIPLSQGLVAIVDDEDFEWLNQWKWSASKQGKRPETTKYRAIRVVTKNGKQRPILMHRALLGARREDIVDHINGNPLDNRRENLRICTQQQNMFNGSAHVDGMTSEFKGVCWDKDRRKWRVAFQGKYVGIFDNELVAAASYDEVALVHAGPYAKLNFPKEVSLVQGH